MTANEPSELTPEQKERPRESVRGALASSYLSGGIPTPEAISNLEAYIQGQATIDELVEAAINRHRQA
jgi:hypothetical protein